MAAGCDELEGVSAFGLVEVDDPVVIAPAVDATGYVFPGFTRQTRTVRNPRAATAMRLMVLAVSPL